MFRTTTMRRSHVEMITNGLHEVLSEELNVESPNCPLYTTEMGAQQHAPQFRFVFRV